MQTNQPAKYSVADRLAGRVAVVTGASRGIGRAIAERLGRDGASVVVNYVASDDASGDVVAAIEVSGGSAHAIKADASDVADIRRLFDESVKRFAKIDIAVLSAGISVMKPIAEVTEADFDRVFALNARGVFFALQAAARHVTDGGAIVTLSSGTTVSAGSGGSLYPGSKAAAEQFTAALAKELGPRGVSVNTVSPGPTNTDNLRLQPPVVERLKSTIPFGRIGEPDDIANVVAFLVGPDGHWVNGQNIRANGGLV